MNAATLTGMSRLSVTALGTAARAARQRITVQVVAATFAIAVVLEVWTVFDFVIGYTWDSPGIGPFPAGREIVSAAIINLLMAFAVMFTTRIADEIVARGAPRMRAYALAVVIGCATAALTQWWLHAWLHLTPRLDGTGDLRDLLIMQPVAVFFEYLIWATIIVFIYVNRRTALAASKRMNAAQIEQARARRRTLESQLQALQARVEPQFLFNTLASVRNLYEKDPEQGGPLLEELIVYLRSALPRLRESASTLDRELELVAAYMSIMRTHPGDRFTFLIERLETHAVREAQFPPMILLPLLDCVLDAGGSTPGHGEVTVRLVVGNESDRLRVELSCDSGRPIGDRLGSVLRDVDDRLHALYGDGAGVDVRSSSDAGFRATIEIPYEPADRNHR